VLFFINDYLIPGIVIGCIYSMGAIGVSLVFGNLRFANFAHGALMTIGAYFALTFLRLTGLPLVAVLPLAMLATGLLCVALDRLFLRPFRASATIISLIASFGLALMIQSSVQLIWGVGLQSYVPGVIQRPIMVFDAVRISPRHIWIIASAMVLMLLLHLLLSRTKIGKAMRAMSDSAELARLTGIDTERVIVATWMIAGGLAAAAGVMLGYDTQLKPMMGFEILLPIFAAAILGGIGQPYGAMAGGLVIGIAQELVSYPWIGTAPLISPSYKEGVAFAIMVIMLIWRPSGLFKGRVYT
jgi:branched-chain amino acid transport system permease protein